MRCTRKEKLDFEVPFPRWKKKPSTTRKVDMKLGIAPKRMDHAMERKKKLVVKRLDKVSFVQNEIRGKAVGVFVFEEFVDWRWVMEETIAYTFSDQEQP